MKRTVIIILLGLVLFLVPGRLNAQVEEELTFEEEEFSQEEDVPGSSSNPAEETGRFTSHMLRLPLVLVTALLIYNLKAPRRKTDEKI